MLSLIRPDIEPSGTNAVRVEASSGDSIHPVIQLAITLRILAGGSYLEGKLWRQLTNDSVTLIFPEKTRSFCKKWARFNNLLKGAFPIQCLQEMVEYFEELSLLLRRWMGMCDRSMFIKVFGDHMVCKHLLMPAVNSG